MFTCPRPSERLTDEPAAGGPDRIQPIILATQPPLTAGLAANLEHRLVALGKEAAETRAVMTGTLDRPQTSARRVPLRETTRLGIAASACLDNGLRDHRSRASGNDRERVLIAVGIDTDHVVQLVCKHPTDPPTRLAGSSDAGLMQGNRAAGL